MIEILDTCSVSIAGEPSGGITLRMTDIEGRPGVSILVPIAKESAEQLLDGAATLMGKPKLQTANLQDLRSMTHD